MINNIKERRESNLIRKPVVNFIPNNIHNTGNSLNATNPKSEITDDDHEKKEFPLKFLNEGEIIDQY